jgi:eukaryotic-like serine/threonine-protein kinase
VNDPRTTAYVAWMDGFLAQASGEDQGQRIRQALAEHGQWIDVGNAIDLIHVLCFDALLRGDKDVLTETFHRREALVAASDQSTQVARHASTAGLLALRGRCAEAKAWLEQMRLEAGPRPQRWQVADIFYGAVMVAVECDEYGEEFDDEVAAFEAHRFTPRTLIPAELGLFIYIAYGRLEQCRAAGPDERPARLAQARAAVATARQAARSVIQRAHVLVLSASLRQVAGEHERALRGLDAGASVLRRADAALLAFEAARVRALALRALHINGEADRQAGQALAVASEQEWPRRAARAAAEFGRRLDPDALAPAGPPASGLDMVRTGSSARIALSRYRARLEAVEQVGFAASRVLDPDRLVAIALDEIIRILNAERAFLFLMEGEPLRLMPHRGRTAEGQDLRELTGYSATLVERVCRTQSPLVITGTEEGAALGARSVLTHDLRSIIIAPLEIEQRLLGAVYLDSRVAKGIFTIDDVGVLIAIANQIAVALETARAAQLEVAVAAAIEQREVAETLRDALVDIGATLEPEQVLRRLLTTVLNRTTSEAGWLVLPRSDEQKARLVTGTDAVESIVDVDGRLRRLLRIDSVEEHTTSTGAPDVIMTSFPQARSWMAVPLNTRDERLGILLLAARASHAYDEGATQVAVAIAGQGMIAYEKAQLFSQVQRLATTDSLTSVANRRHFFDEAARRMSRSRRLGLPLTAMMVDIDDFKQINDEYGHQVGDEVIQAVAARLQRQGRSGDLLGRYGGEEFAILQQSGADDAPIAERLRTAISDTPIDTAAGPVRVTVSIGLSQLRAGDATVSSLLARADQLMYEAKRAGRNRVEVG